MTLLGIETFVRPTQPENAEFPMLVTLLEKLIVLKLVHPEKAQCPIIVVFFPITTLFKLVHL